LIFSFFFLGEGIDESSSSRHSLILLVGLLVAFLLSLIITAYLLIHQKKRRNANRLLPKAGVTTTLFRGELVEDELGQGAGASRRFSYNELTAATDNFSDNRALGRGGFGSVYQGFLSDINSEVAIKRVSETSRQGWKEFVSEVSIISRLRHRNLVQLIGWCHGGDELLLVYDLMHNGSLDNHLYRPDSVMAWPVRYVTQLINHLSYPHIIILYAHIWFLTPPSYFYNF
jgi:interleukin-1 receptor-associated kinase 1